MQHWNELHIVPSYHVVAVMLPPVPTTRYQAPGARYTLGLIDIKRRYYKKGFESDFTSPHRILEENQNQAASGNLPFWWYIPSIILPKGDIGLKGSTHNSITNTDGFRLLADVIEWCRADNV